MDRAGVEEVVVAAEVVAVKDLRGGVLAEEGVGAGVGRRVADADGDGVEIEANLGAGRKGRQGEHGDCGNAAKLHGESSKKSDADAAPSEERTFKSIERFASGGASLPARAIYRARPRARGAGGG